MGDEVIMKQHYIQQDRCLVGLIILACFLSNISQLPYFVSSGMTQMLNMPMWIILLAYILLTRRLKVNYQMLKVFGASCAVVIGLLICTMATGNSYFESSIISCLILSMFIYCLGEFAGRNVSDSGLRSIMMSYAVSSVIVSGAVYVEYFSTNVDLSSKVYAYASKNSVSQIIFTCIVILMFVKFDKKALNAVRLVAIIFEVFLLILLRSRATIIGFMICLLYIIAGKSYNRKLKYLLSIILVAGIFIMLTNDSVSNMVFNNILFAGRDATNLDALTSGRISILTSFPEKIQGHWLAGIGSTYFECFPLSAILQFGIVVGTIILGLSYLPIAKCFKLDRKNVYGSIFVVVCIGYAINSIFEGLAPIGPGVKCYFMWLLYGLLEAQKRIRQ